MKSSRILNTKRNMIAGLLTRILDLIFPFVINTVVIHTLGVEYLGLNSLFASVLQVLSLAELGVGSALVFSMYEPIANGDTLKVCSLLRLYRKIYITIGSVILSLGLISIPFLPKLIKGDVPDGLNIYILFMISLANTSVSYFLFSYRSSLLQASQRIDLKEIIAMIANSLLNVSKILILITTKNYYLFCIVVPVFTVISNIVTWVVTHKKFPEYRCYGTISKEEKREIKKRISGLFINRLCDVICNSFDSIVISGFLGLVILGKYNNYFYIMNALMTLMGIVIASAVPSIGNSIAKESQEKNYADFSVLQFGYSWLTGWISICLLCLYQPFIELRIGKEMLMDMRIVVLFCIYLYTVKTSEVFMSYRQAAGIWANDKVRPILEAALNLVLNILLVKTVGVEGVMLSTIFTLGLIHIIWGSYYLFKEYFTDYRQSVYLLKLIYYTLVVIIAAFATYYICTMFNLTGFACLLVRGIICIIVPNIIFVGAYIWRPEFRQLVNLAKSTLKR